MLELRSAHGVACQLATEDEELLRAAESLGFSDARTADPVPAESAAAPAPAAATV